MQEQKTEDTAKELETFVFDTIATFGPDRAAISRDATLRDLEVDSIDMVELTQLVEDRYDVRLDPAELEGVQTVGDAIGVIEAKIA